MIPSPNCEIRVTAHFNRRGRLHVAATVFLIGDCVLPFSLQKILKFNNTFHVTEGRVQDVHRQRIDDDLCIMNAFIFRRGGSEYVIEPLAGQRLEDRHEQIDVDLDEGFHDAIHVTLGQNGVGQAD